MAVDRQSWVAARWVTGLVFGHSVVEHAAMVVLMTYLMAEWKEDLQKSAATVNINQGLTSVITLAFAHLADTYVGCFKMVFFSTISYVIGLSLLCLSTLKLFRHTKVCLFYIALAMIAMGRAGRNSTLKPFLAYQFRAKYQEDDDDRVQSRTKVCWSFAWQMGILVTYFTLPNPHWPQTLELSTYVMLIALAIFSLGMPFYHCPATIEAQSPLTTVFKVFKVAILRRHLNVYPLHESNRSFTLLQTNQFRWLDKAAMLKASSINPVEEEKMGRLCTITQVEETKLILEMVPIWMAFLVYVLVKSTGENFFIEQATKMNGCNKTILALSLIKSFLNLAISWFYESIQENRIGETHKRKATLVRIGLGMLSSLCCCTIAWRVETRRLSSLDTNNGSMNIMWLVPQFCCLGLMEGLAEDGIEMFFYFHVSKRMVGYGKVFTDFVIGMGNFVSAVTIYASRKWFRYTLNNSRLDKYYRMLAILSYVNLWYHFYVSRKMLNKGN
ncbi:Protein NRT1/ PTR FAMILY 5.6 [Camellia lanceoleosa]|nr:Protein NRT1/ PTR FAMILY 5.6 [Camellia lanceoleosa]